MTRERRILTVIQAGETYCDNRCLLFWRSTTSLLPHCRRFGPLDEVQHRSIEAYRHRGCIREERDALARDEEMRRGAKT